MEGVRLGRLKEQTVPGPQVIRLPADVVDELAGQAVDELFTGVGHRLIGVAGTGLYGDQERLDLLVG